MNDDEQQTSVDGERFLAPVTPIFGAPRTEEPAAHGAADGATRETQRDTTRETLRSMPRATTRRTANETDEPTEATGSVGSTRSAGASGTTAPPPARLRPAPTSTSASASMTGPAAVAPRLSRDRARQAPTASPSIDELVALPSRAAAIAAAESTLIKRLRRADRSREELRRELEHDRDLQSQPETCLDPAGIEAVLDRLTELGYIDDDRMAAAIATKLIDRKGKGIDGVRYELRRRLLDDVVIDRTLQQYDRDDEFERAAETARARAQRLGNVDPETALRRLTGYLQRRGFSSGVALIAAGEALHAPGGARARPAADSPRDRVFFGNTDT